MIKVRIMILATCTFFILGCSEESESVVQNVISMADPEYRCVKSYAKNIEKAEWLQPRVNNTRGYQAWLRQYHERMSKLDTRECPLGIFRKHESLITQAKDLEIMLRKKIGDGLFDDIRKDMAYSKLKKFGDDNEQLGMLVADYIIKHEIEL